MRVYIHTYIKREYFIHAYAYIPLRKPAMIKSAAGKLSKTSAANKNSAIHAMTNTLSKTVCGTKGMNTDPAVVLPVGLSVHSKKRTCMYMHIHIYTYMCESVCVCACDCACASACEWICKYVYIYKYKCVNMYK